MVRIAVFIVVVASFVVITELMMKAYFFSLSQSLGIFIPLIVVNCIILGRAEAFASKNTVVLSAADGLGIGLGYTLALTFLGSIREIFGAGSLFGFRLLPASVEPFAAMVKPPGAFVCLGLILAAMNLYTSWQQRRGSRTQEA